MARRKRRDAQHWPPRWARRWASFLLGFINIGGVVGCCMFAGPRYEGPPSDHFDGAHFVNQGEVIRADVGRFLKWQTSRDRQPWADVLGAEPGPAPPKRVGAGQLRVTWVGHATVLVQMDGKNVLTDPIWSEQATPIRGVGPKRVRPPGIRFEELPPIDAVVVSHNHYDHLDLPTLRRLHDAHRPEMFVGLGNRALLEQDGIDRVTEMDWWQSVDLGDGVRVFMVPAQHFSARSLCDMDATLWGGWVLRGAAGVVYFAGDTGFGPHFQQVRDRFGPPRMAILPIGAYLPRWFMKYAHVDPDDAVRAHRVLGAETSMGMHWGTFAQADDGQDQPPRDLAAALQSQGVDAQRFWLLGFGEGRAVP